MIELLKKLCEINAPSGAEENLAEFIKSEIDGFCEYKTDNSGNIIAFKKGKNRSAKRLMVDAHMDEVGIIVTYITESGFLKFKTVGGIDVAALLGKRVIINSKIPGVIGLKPIHLLSSEQAKQLPKEESLCIDIGAKNKEQAELQVKPGDLAVLDEPFILSSGKILSKAIDDRAGCAVLIKLLKEESEYDFYATFTVGEEIGLRGAKTAAYSVNPQSAIVLEATTASDIAGTDEEKRVCTLSGGAAVSFMDRATLYDRKYYEAAINSGIKCQPKSAVAGGNNSGAIHLSREGVRTIAISLPCRYIHTASCVAEECDLESVYALAKYMIKEICSGNLE
ncbi:MAG: M42 family peptidase [Clostridia bacterium]|nr:M42 family peptidase [Clostridia bacterium]